MPARGRARTPWKSLPPSPRWTARTPCTWSAGPSATCCWAASRTSWTSWSRATRWRSRAAPPSAWAGGVTVHERFGTATVEAPDATFDLAGARRERYERPGALPDVELGASLRDDLARRDFTVNAIALHLADGELIWFPQRRGGPARRPAAGAARRLVPRRPDAPAAARALRRPARVRARPAHGRAGRAGRGGRRAGHGHRRRGSAPSCGCCCASRSRRRSPALERHGLGARAARPALRGRPRPRRARRSS